MNVVELINVYEKRWMIKYFAMWANSMHQLLQIGIC
jgi:hypothetical protein